MRLLIVAPPGAGKGTQAARLADHFGIEHIASGDLLRAEVAAGTPLGKQAKEYLDRGELVPDDVVLYMIGGRVVAANEAGGFVLDGFPRNLEQAHAGREFAADVGVLVDAVIYLDVSDEEAERRLLARAEVENRSDDRADTIRNRLELFHKVTQPLMDYYEGRGLLIRIDGDQPVDGVTKEILEKLDRLGTA